MKSVKLQQRRQLPQKFTLPVFGKKENEQDKVHEEELLPQQTDKNIMKSTIMPRKDKLINEEDMDAELKKGYQLQLERMRQRLAE
jgi:hypothetical protein